LLENRAVGLWTFVNRTGYDAVPHHGRKGKVSHRLVKLPAGRIRRRTLVGHVLGVGPDSRIDSLKMYLHAATLTPTPTEKLDLVMLEDFDHFAELIAVEGIPLAREDALEPPLEPARNRVHIQAHVGWAAVTLLVFVVTVGDDVVKLITGFDPIPWF
jgi:hypothetical protein